MAETVVSEKLYAKFKTAADTNVTLGVNAPVSDLDAETTATALDTVIGQNVFQDKDGSPITDIVSAYIDTTTRLNLIGEA